MREKPFRGMSFVGLIAFRSGSVQLKMCEVLVNESKSLSSLIEWSGRFSTYTLTVGRQYPGIRQVSSPKAFFLKLPDALFS